MPNKTEKFQILLLFLIWKEWQLIITYLSPLIIQKFAGHFPYFSERLYPANLPHFLWSAGNFDGVHYLGIAKDAYSHQYTQVFFPLYPILIKAGEYLTHNLILSGVLISNIALLVAIYFLHSLVKMNYGKNVAIWSVIFVLAFPTSFYFGAVYY